jgi:hypothetical protein
MGGLIDGGAVGFDDYRRIFEAGHPFQFTLESLSLAPDGSERVGQALPF